MLKRDKKPTKKQLLNAIRKLEENPNDKLRILGDIGITSLGAVAAGGVVSAIGVPVSIPVITALTGYVVIGATPIGWVAGAAAAGGAAAYGVSRLIKNGAEIEGKKKELLSQLKEKLKDVEIKERASKISDDDKTKFFILLKYPLEMNWIGPEEAQSLVSAVENGQIPLSQAYQLIQDITKAEGKDPANPKSKLSAKDSSQLNLLKERLISLLYGDEEQQSRLINQAHSQYPHKSEVELYEIVITKLLRDRN